MATCKVYGRMASRHVSVFFFVIENVGVVAELWFAYLALFLSISLPGKSSTKSQLHIGPTVKRTHAKHCLLY